MVKIFENKFFQFLIFVIMIVFVAFLLSSISKNMEESEINTITISGEGEIYATPDIALIDVSVVTENKTVADAMENNTDKMNNIIDALKNNMAIDESDIKTTDFSIYPQYSYNSETGQRSLDGYNISQNINIKIRDLDNVGQIIQTVTSLGANNVSDLSFTFDDDEDLKNQARAEAIDNAKEKASELAKQLGVKIVKIVDFSESSYTPTYNTGVSYKAYDEIALESVSIPSIQTGENRITSNVYITYVIE
jgi:uncharacterized protein YggE